MKHHVESFVTFVALALVAWPNGAPAHETDQITNRADPIADSTEVLNQKVNQRIAEVVRKRRHEEDRMRIVNALFRKLGSRLLVDRIEKWAIKSDKVEKLPTGRFDSVYADHPIWAVRVTKLFGIGETIRVNDQLIGTDKLGHFISQGRKYYRRFLRFNSEEAAARQAAYAEFLVFGQVSNGNFSNADLVANYEGHRFFRSLFEDDIVPGKPAILHWDGEAWIIQREFDWADHVNEYWDEALNVNHYDRLLFPYMHERLVAECPNYWQDPSLYTIEDEEPLKERYAHLGMKENSVLRLDSLCPVQLYLEEGVVLASTR